MNLLHKFNDLIQANNLHAPSKRILIAVSGGVDSVVLAHLIQQSKQPFGIAHCNFSLRGAESDGDEQFVRTLAKQMGVPIFVHHFDTKRYAKENSLSTQMAARELRYRWFDVILEAENFDYIATGHNLNDSVETTILHLIRGTGLSGLSGIPIQNGRVIRPLLFAQRSEIESYAKANKIAWREDSSNLQDEYTRNAIRIHIVPQIEKLNPAFLDVTAKTMQHLHAADTNLQFLLQAFLGEEDAKGVFHIEKSALAKLPALADGLFDLFQPFGFSADQVQQVLTCWDQPGKEWLAPSGYRLLMDRKEILLTNKEQTSFSAHITADDLMVRLPDNSRIMQMQVASGEDFPNGRDTILVDADKLRYPLRMRHWASGDQFKPMGLNGKTQKLQDFFTNHKLSRLEKEQVWILEDSEQTIIWVVGLRLDERFKISEGTSQLVKMNWIKE